MKINRPEVTIEDFNRAVSDLQKMAVELREKAGTGAFAHPHEIVGMATGQLSKLSIAADASNYSGQNTETRERCLKFVYGLLFGVASIDVLDR